MPKVVRKKGPGAAKLQKLIENLKDMHARVGFLESSKYEDGTPIAYIAVIHENGVEEKNIPPRPIFGPTADEHKEDWRELAKVLGKKVMHGEISLKTMLAILAGTAVSDLQERIETIQEPPLADVTIAKRLRNMKMPADNPNKKRIRNASKPLMETELMHDSLTFDVEKGRGDGK